MDQLAAMRAYVRVVETGNFTRASDSLDMPKATVTKLIQGLEAHLRTKLLNRTTRRVLVTPDGALYYERALRLLADIEELDSSMASSSSLPQGRLRVDMSGALASLILIPAMCDFHARYPDIGIDLGVSDRQIDILAENVDCAIRVGELSEPSLIARRISEMSLVTCAAATYVARYGEPRHPRDLEQGHHVVGYFRAENGRQLPFVFNRGDEQLEVIGRSVLSVNDAMTYMTAVRAGMGVAQAPRFMVEDAFRDGTLQPVLTEWNRDAMPIYVVFPPNRHLSNKLRVFVDWVAALFADSGIDGRRSGSQAVSRSAGFPSPPEFVEGVERD
ncbi:LysR family transcriptional regulator [Chelativorans salis]|uniref:LysR family transcriptional regulator n=1 Tax=Chelativorans salis TaxID=2978478 RepID=A0ABT2LTW2_9HYPH|nr:LysR family transcriptional regulator [Chelativorans sp. EGI FJ00035]MCT7377053.1 LysR family transcriptional regulator [Chelativorans sp. EGI FJ00035]